MTQNLFGDVNISPDNGLVPDICSHSVLLGQKELMHVEREIQNYV